MCYRPTLMAQIAKTLSSELIRKLYRTDKLDFDEFYDYVGDFIVNKKIKYNNNLDFETEEKEATCNICISYEDKGQ